MIEPTGYTALDLIGYTDRGAFAVNENYVKNDLVHYDGDIWRVLIDDTMGITPSEGVNYTLFIGEPTNLVERIIAPLEENPATIAYSTGRQIIYNDYLYEVIADIEVGDPLITYEDDPTNANIKLAPPVETQVLAQKAQIQTLTNQVSDISDEIADMNNVLGAKNLYPKVDVGTTIVSGITYTKNSDGSITVNGTASETSYLVSDFPSVTLPAGTYILSGCPDINPDTESNLKTRLYIPSLSVHDYGNGVTFTLDEETTFSLAIRTENGAVLDNVVFKPMIRLASIQDDTYVPYAMTNQEMTPYVQAISNPNLLDNPWFTVNQRGFTSSNTVGYAVDRWHLIWNPNGATISKVSDGLSIDNTQSGAGIVYIFQKFETQELAGKTATASILLSDGTLLEGTGVIPQLNGATIDVITNSEKGIGVSFQNSTTGNTGRIAFRLNFQANASVIIKAVKLELGSVSTLAQDTAPNYSEELLKCQRYFQRYKQSNTDTIAIGAVRSTTKIRFLFDLTTPMRANPTVTASGTVGDYTNTGLTIARTGDNITLGDGSVAKVQLDARSSSEIFTVGQAKNICVTSDDFYIDFSADL